MANGPLNALDREIQWLQSIRKALDNPKFKKLIDDPKSAAKLRELFGSKNGFKHDEASAPGQEATHSQGPVALSKIDMVRKTLVGFKGDEEFTVGLVGDRMRAAGLKLDNEAIGKALQHLVKTEEVQVISQNRGSGGNRYVKTDNLRQVN